MNLSLVASFTANLFVRVMHLIGAAHASKDFIPLRVPDVLCIGRIARCLHHYRHMEAEEVGSLQAGSGRCHEVLDSRTNQGNRYVERLGWLQYQS